MNTYISILRGINVGGRRKLPMAELRELLSELGYTDVKTYIQSGNVLLSASEEATTVSQAIAEAISRRYDYDVPTLTIEADEWLTACAQNPFIIEGNEDINRLHMTVLSDIPSEQNLDVLKDYEYPPDRYEVHGRYVYIYCADKYHTSKLSNNFFEKKLKVSTTTRNWKTVIKLASMIKDS